MPQFSANVLVFRVGEIIWIAGNSHSKSNGIAGRGAFLSL